MSVLRFEEWQLRYAQHLLDGGLSPSEIRLAGELLQLAAEEFSRHGCNDFKRPEWYPQSEWDALEVKWHTANGDPHEARIGRQMSDDWILMHWLGVWLTNAPHL